MITGRSCQRPAQRDLQDRPVNQFGQRRDHTLVIPETSGLSSKHRISGLLKKEIKKLERGQ